MTFVETFVVFWLAVLTVSFVVVNDAQNKVNKALVDWVDEVNRQLDKRDKNDN